MADDILQKVAENEIPLVLKAMEKDWPKNFLLHQFLTITEEYKKKKIQVPQQTLYRYGKIEDGVYLVETKIPIGSECLTDIFIHTNSTDLTDLSKVLMETSRIPWLNRFYLFEITMSKFTPCIRQAATAKGVNLTYAENTMFWVPPEVTMEEGEVPDDMFLDYLNDSHVSEIDRNWPHRFPGSEHFVSTGINNNFGLGLFRKSDKKMVSSSLSLHSGGIFLLYSDPEFRGKGYAALIVQRMVKEIRKRGRIPFATVLLVNTPSQNLFKKIGFKEFSNVEFIFFVDNKS